MFEHAAVIEAREGILELIEMLRGGLVLAPRAVALAGLLATDSEAVGLCRRRSDRSARRDPRGPLASRQPAVVVVRTPGALPRPVGFRPGEPGRLVGARSDLP